MSGNSASVSFLDQALVSGGNFLSGIVAARTLGPTEFGVYVIVTMIVMEAVSLHHALTLQPMIVNGASLSDRAFVRFFGAHVVIQAGMISAGALVVLAIALIWEPLRAVALPLVLASAAWQAQEFCRRVLYTRGRMVAAAVNNGVSFDVQAVALIVLAWSGAMTIESTLWTVAATSLLGVVVGVWQLKAYVGRERDSIVTTARETFGLGRWTAGSYSLSAVTLGAYPALIATFSDLRNTAGLGIIRQVIGPVHLLTRPLESYFLPAATRALHQGGTPAMTRVLWRATRICGPIFVVYLGTLLFGGQWIVELVFGAEYAEHAGALLIFVLVELIWFPVTVLRLELSARKLQRYILWAEVWSVLVVYGVGLILINSLGLVGAGLAHLIVNIGALVLTLAVLRRERHRASCVPAAFHGLGGVARPD
jgi:O-antigen/teichoic acid export membrane protein